MTYNIGMKYVVCTGVCSHLVVLLLSIATAAEVLRNKIFLWLCLWGKPFF